MGFEIELYPPLLAARRGLRHDRINAGGLEGLGHFLHLARAALVAMAQSTETVMDHEEDPGIEPDPAFAAQQIADDEIRGILAAAMARVETKQ